MPPAILRSNWTRTALSKYGKRPSNQYLLRLAAVREVAQSGDAAVEVFLKGRRETLTDNYRIP
jgi:hypothetical protein